MELVDILKLGIEKGCSDIFIVPGGPVSMKVAGFVIPMLQEKIKPEESEHLLKEVYKLDNHRNMDSLLQRGDDDFSFSLKGIGRFRCNAYKQRGSLAAVLRVVSFGLPNPDTMHIPKKIMDMHEKRKGLILITGPAGSGKSTTLACLIDKINSECKSHIITLEDPIEYLHFHKNSIVSQREISHDTKSYPTALRAALRQAPNVILVGEMRDFETIQTAMTAAETGQLILSTLHTIGAAKTIDRIIDVFPARQQHQIQTQLSMVLEAVVSQQLIPTIDGELEPAFEIMIVNNAIRNMIREGKVHQMDNVIYGGKDQGMRTMDGDILRLYKEGKITKENALLYAISPEVVERKL